MVDYEHILLATDFSEHSEAAGQRAVDIARRYKAKLTLFHAVEIYIPEIIPIEWSDAINNQELESCLTRDARKELAEFAKRLDASNVDQIVVSSSHSPKHKILTFVKEHGIDLIIMGSHGRRGIDVLLGSTASGVVNRANCDVLSVRI